MGRIKINFLSGTSIEKPLVTAFKGTNGDYVVFDNEISGSMGLPIILISKLEGANLSKIADKSAEWDAVKEALRQVIAGTHTDYINVPLEVSAPDEFFTQLTLPVNSFNLLKSKYVVTTGDVLAAAPAAPTPEAAPAEPAPAAPAPEAAPAQPAPATPAPEAAPAQPAPAAPAPEAAPAQPAPAAPTPEAAPAEPAPATPAPEAAPAEPAPAAPTPEAAPAQPAPATPAPEAAPVQPAPATPAPEAAPAQPDFTADKEAFLKACENMFDALIAKINK